jgi:hypothetical protein
MKREAASAMRVIHRHLLAAILVVAAGGTVTAQTRDGRYGGPTGAIPPAAIAAPTGGPAWSGESGGSGDPRMTAAAIREAAANFRGCLERLWPLAARRGISRKVSQPIPRR